MLSINKKNILEISDNDKKINEIYCNDNLIYKRRKKIDILNGNIRAGYSFKGTLANRRFVLYGGFVRNYRPIITLFQNIYSSRAFLNFCLCANAADNKLYITTNNRTYNPPISTFEFANFVIKRNQMYKFEFNEFGELYIDDELVYKTTPQTDNSNFLGITSRFYNVNEIADGGSGFMADLKIFNGDILEHHLVPNRELGTLYDKIIDVNYNQVGTEKTSISTKIVDYDFID